MNCYEHVKLNLGSIKCVKYLYQLRNYQILKNGFFSYSHILLVSSKMCTTAEHGANLTRISVITVKV